MSSWIGNIIGSWLRRDAAQGFGLTDPRLSEVFGATPAAAGIAVTPATAMRSTPVRCAVQTIAEAIGQLPVHVFERKPDGSRERATDHPAYGLLRDEANDWTSASDFFEQVTRDALLHGNGFAFVNRPNGGLRELIRLDPMSVTIERQRLTGEPLYRVQEDGGHRYIDRRDMIHIKAPSLNGVAGESPVRLGQEAISLALGLVCIQGFRLMDGSASKRAKGASLEQTNTDGRAMEPDRVSSSRSGWAAWP